MPAAIARGMTPSWASTTHIEVTELDDWMRAVPRMPITNDCSSLNWFVSRKCLIGALKLAFMPEPSRSMARKKR